MLDFTLSILLCLLTVYRTGAQTSPPSSDDGDTFNGYRTNFSAATGVLVVAIVTGFFFLAFFSIYFRRCSRNRSAVVPSATVGAVTASRRGARGGLDPAVIETFPTLAYSAVTGLKIGKETLECAVCLSEFDGDETLRMLPRCCHVFHPECIDTWLQSHLTCPVCRDNLSVVPTESSRPEVDAGAGGGETVAGDGTSGGSCVDDVEIDLTRIGRSHTVGHQVAGGDRYTLRLPEHVRREIVEAGRLRRSASMAVFPGGGEGSSRRGFRGSWMGLSERWTSGILARVTTWRRGEFEGSVKTGEGSTKGGKVDCGGGGGGGGERGESSSNADSDKSVVAVLDRV